MSSYLYSAWNNLAGLVWYRKPVPIITPIDVSAKGDLEDMTAALMCAYRDIKNKEKLEITYILNRRYRRVTIEKHFSTLHKNNSAFILIDELIGTHFLESSYIQREILDYEALLAAIDQRGNYKVELPISVEKEVYKRTNNHSLHRLKEGLEARVSKNIVQDILESTETLCINTDISLEEPKRYLHFKLGKQLNITSASLRECHDLALLARE